MSLPPNTCSHFASRRYQRRSLTRSDLVLIIFIFIVFVAVCCVHGVGVPSKGQSNEQPTKSAKDCERGTHNCHKDAECLSSRRAYRCKCKDGFYGDGKICVDDDECKFENGGCVHSCQNTPGNFTCSCYPGFTLASDGLDCIDKNECLENKGGCAQQCINTIGSFECRCNAGYSLHSDGKTCNTGTWCRTVMGCEHFCSSSSPPRCACRPGYKQDTDEKKCLQMCSVGNGGCQHICKDTTTGPVCSCQKNYILASDRQSCIASRDKPTKDNVNTRTQDKITQQGQHKFILTWRSWLGCHLGLKSTATMV